ncbi:hypothetical protein HPB50_003960 [Hyalomma asiaticum]|uniref:Uncharacterized protein n=1 Tax=Hyalomma asiaticum TaxID=266040 RepID=A0ACB7RLD4_HYAAI|nr:hypothetical protein HPB50_003960 [Hyalomma asiaticum]
MSTKGVATAVANTTTTGRMAAENTTATTTTGPTGPTGTTTIATAKPPLVCHLVSPAYANNISDHFYVLSQTLPNPGVCDFVVLDLPFTSNGTYPPDSYEFLPNGTAYKYLFTISVVEGSYKRTQTALRSQLFKETVRTIRQVQRLPLYGFGILRDLPIPSSNLLAGGTAGPLSSVYQLSVEVRTCAKTENAHCEAYVLNLGSMSHYSLTLRRGIYEGLLNAITRIGTISLIFILTVTDEQSKFVLPSSAWDESCLPLSNEVKMKDVVDLISSIPSPNVIFTLTLSLRFDTFSHVRMVDLGQSDVTLMLSYDHLSDYYDRGCRDFFQHDAKGACAVYFGGGGCMFAPKHGTHGVVSFDTPETLRHKMVAAYRHLGYGMTNAYVIGWSVYNVTHGLAPPHCNGTDNRISQIRKVLDENK